MITDYADILEIDSDEIMHDFISACIDRIGTEFHPDTDFREYKTDNNRRIFKREFAQHLNGLMDQCFHLCDARRIDIYAYVIDIMKSKQKTAI